MWGVCDDGAPAWGAEQPELHILPHIESWCQQDGRLKLRRAYSDEAGAYMVAFEWCGGRGSVGAARSAAFAPIGSFAQSASYVRQRRVDGPNGSSTSLRFEVGTGELSPERRFAPHGHVVIIDVDGVLQWW